MVRIQNPKPEQKQPRDTYGWTQLAQRAIAAAEKGKDRRAVGLRRALVNGLLLEKTLRQMGIICDADILREFPGGV